MKNFSFLKFSFFALIISSGSAINAQMYQDSSGKWLNSAGGNLYGNSNLNWEANPNLNWKANPNLNWKANPNLNWNGK